MFCCENSMHLLSWSSSNFTILKIKKEEKLLYNLEGKKYDFECQGCVYLEYSFGGMYANYKKQ